MVEEWRDVTGYEGIYQVSNTGKVRSLDRTDCRGQRRRGKELKPASPQGYKLVMLSKNGVVSQGKVHALVAEAFMGERPDGLFINHKDLDSLNNHVDNLEYVTPKENTQHFYRSGHGDTFSAKDVVVIRRLHEEHNKSASAIAKEFGVSGPTIKRLLAGETHTSAWAKLGKQPGNAYSAQTRKLSAEEVRKIRSLCKNGNFTYKELGEKFGVDKKTIYRVVRKESYPNI